MIKLKQFVAVALMGLALIVGSEAMAKKSSAACAKNQWLNGKKCAVCPANATCNGQIFKCNKNFTQSGSKCVQTTCTKGQWMNGKKCATCPANATCKDGRIFTCNKNFTQKGNTCIAATCAKGQWMNGSKCAACPANATCKDGKTFVCNKNFTKKGNACITTTCPKGQWMNGSKCATCPANATCNDGKTFTCQKDYILKGGKCTLKANNTPCKHDEFFAQYNGRCTACPQFAKCDGKNFSCVTGYFIQNWSGKPAACARCGYGDKYFDGKNCQKCPQNATCKNSSASLFVCNKGFKRSGNKCVKE